MSSRLTADDELRLATIDRVRNDLNNIWPLLSESNVLWHRTSVSCFEAIAKCGFLKPNLGQFDNTTRQSASSYGRSIGAICLFDFVTEPEETVVYEADKWLRFLSDMGAATVLIKIARPSLDKANLVSPAGIGFDKVRIPYVECWYKGDISAKFFREIVLVRRPHYEYIVLSPDDVDGLNKLGHRWAAVEEMEANQKKADGVFSLEDLVIASMEND
jgi:hypothetical protein